MSMIYVLSTKDIYEIPVCLYNTIHFRFHVAHCFWYMISVRQAFINKWVHCSLYCRRPILTYTYGASGHKTHSPGDPQE